MPTSKAHHDKSKGYGAHAMKEYREHATDNAHKTHNNSHSHSPREGQEVIGTETGAGGSDIASVLDSSISYEESVEKEDELDLLALPLLTVPLTACVFGSSAKTTPQTLLTGAHALGVLLAKRGHSIITGGGAYGCMHGVQSGCRENGGRVRGVVHQKFVDGGSADLGNLSDMVITTGDDLEERKRLLMDGSSCLLVCPGGVGTYDELWDCVSHRSLGMKGLGNKPIILLNTDGFYDGFIQQIERACVDKLLYLPTSSYFSVAKTPSQCVKLAEEQVQKARERDIQIQQGQGGSASNMGASRMAPIVMGDGINGVNSADTNSSNASSSSCSDVRITTPTIVQEPTSTTYIPMQSEEMGAAAGKEEKGEGKGNINNQKEESASTSTLWTLYFPSTLLSLVGASADKDPKRAHER